MESVAHPSLDTPLIEHLTDLGQARQIALGCVRCDLAATRTQVVFGEGVPTARLMLVGEGPGAEEDRQGRPFVGRAGQLLDAAIAQAGLSRDQGYVTNVVRCRPVKVSDAHLENRPPRAGEIGACRVWMDAELRLVAPRALLCLGAVAAKALIDKDLRLLEARGQWLSGPRGIAALATLHPSYVLRQRDPEARDRARRMLVEDLSLAARALTPA